MKSVQYKFPSPLVWLLLLLLSGCAIQQGHGPEQRYLQQLEGKSASGDAESQYQLGLHYSTSAKWTWDKWRAHGYFKKAAAAGHVDAQYMLAMGLLVGRGTLQDQPAAVAWLERAANKGHARAQYQLAQAFLNGTGTEKETVWGRYWLEQAAWAGHAEGQLLLAALFSKGIGGKKNLSEAWHWLKRSELSGNKLAAKALRQTENFSGQSIKIGENLFLKTSRKDLDGLFLTPKIRYLQTMLNFRGFSAGTEDGEDGPKTQNALKNYRIKNKMPHSSSLNETMEQLRGKK
ncbi:TPR repeat [Malonomonas rubra DSM 5091]|uniref:TPR repeat n=1 Tax=Malonomonas rubra DSM 5091 TaxID=1122189 RepID=A0A1M6IXP2_MALRU|nr:tetratricopeptide repeat protein [Malonomonas rubra]SHJ39181.1 TPR repeat [Malonomonas rubra DSM 5091]